jgi:hypothetical protein
MNALNTDNCLQHFSQLFLLINLHNLKKSYKSIRLKSMRVIMTTCPRLTYIKLLSTILFTRISKIPNQNIVYNMG